MALRYLLDTDTCIYIAKRNPPGVTERLARIEQGEVGMSVITFGELVYGAEKSSQRKQAFKVLDSLQELVPVVDVTPDVALRYGEVRSHLSRQGKIIGGNDLWIAAHALTLKVILITNNLREFARVPKLKSESWVTTK